jgi:hypothetical protein
MQAGESEEFKDLSRKQLRRKYSMKIFLNSTPDGATAERCCRACFAFFASWPQRSKSLPLLPLSPHNVARLVWGFHHALLGIYPPWISISDPEVGRII